MSRQGVEDNVRAAATASDDYSTRFAQYQRACADLNWTEAERLRTEVVALLESYLDQLAAIYRRIDDQARSEA